MNDNGVCCEFVLMGVEVRDDALFKVVIKQLVDLKGDKGDESSWWR